MMNIDDTVYVPITTAQSASSAQSTCGQYTPGTQCKSMSSANDEIVSVLTARLGKAEAFSISNQADVLEAAQDVTRVFTVLLAGIAGVSLLVGGIGL